MSIDDELRAVLKSPAESTTVDFKESVDWASTRARIELCRDIVCLANRTGGLIVVGVADRGGGRWDPVGLKPGDGLPDPTELGKSLARYFDPPPRFTSAEPEANGQRFGVILVEEFDRTPIVCKADGNDQNNRLVIAKGDFYRRTDAMQCEKLSSANAVQGLVEAAVAKTGAATFRMLSQGVVAGAEARPPREVARAPTERPAIAVPQDDAGPLASDREPLRVCNLSPDGSVEPLSVLDLLGKISTSVVRIHGGPVLVPRAIDPRGLEPSAIVREPGRVLIDVTRREDNLGRVSSVVEATTDLSMKIREGLWETEQRVDFTTLVTWPLACLLFAARFYNGTKAARINVTLGLANPLGLRLTVNPSQFFPFTLPYTATSTVDLLAYFHVAPAELLTGKRRIELAQVAVEELTAYFGFTLTDATWMTHTQAVGRSIPGIFDDVPEEPAV